MLAHLAEFAGRQYDLLQSARGADFVPQLYRWLSQLYRRPEVASILEETEAAGVRLTQAHYEVDKQFCENVIALRVELGTLVPSLAAVDPPPPDTPGVDTGLYSLAHFDLRAQKPFGEPPLPVLSRTVDDGRSHFLLRALGHVLEEQRVQMNEGRPEPTDLHETLRDLHQRTSALMREREQAHLVFIQELRTAPGIALQAIRHALRQIFVSIIPGDNDKVSSPVLRSVQLPPWLVDAACLKKGTFDSRTLGKGAAAEFEEEVEKLRSAARRVNEELREQIGSRRSLLTLMKRFKRRCEWHDAARLRGLVLTLPSRSEAILTAELATWLFDQGYSPISTPLTGRLRPDLVDLSLTDTLYIEAKQYGNPSRAYLLKGFAQVADTLGRLSGQPYRPAEAFYVVFRVAGPRYELPEVLRLDNRDVHLLLIDLAAEQESGSRANSQPEVISEAEFYGTLTSAAPRQSGTPRVPRRGPTTNSKKRRHRNAKRIRKPNDRGH